MSNKKITDLSEITTPASGDYLPIVDVSDTTDDATGTSKKIKYSNVGSQVANVKSYGALGDGSTDDSSAIQDALDSISTGGTLYFPAGTYIIGTTLNLYSNISLVSAGGSGDSLDQTTTDSLVILKAKTNLDSPIIDLNDCAGLNFDNIEFDGNGTNQTTAAYLIDGKTYTTTVSGTLAVYFVNIVFNNCVFKNCKTGKFAVAFGTAASGIENIQFNNCSFNNNLGGAFTADGGVIWPRFTNCNFFYNESAASILYINNSNLYISGCEFGYNTGTMIIIDNSTTAANSTNMIIGNDFESTGANTLVIVSNVANKTVVANNVGNNSGAPGFYFSSSDYFSCTGNVLAQGGSGVGVRVTTCNKFNISGNTIMNSGGNAVTVDVGSCDYYVIANNVAAGASVVDGGTGIHKIIENNI
jgi:hypothetical protein